jgi:rare lipoprotein A (peptidoglycan hydrolase)
LAIVTDRGPAKRLYRKGRIVDLSVAAFKEIASLKQGIIEVKVEVQK